MANPEGVSAPSCPLRLIPESHGTCIVHTQIYVKRPISCKKNKTKIKATVLSYTCQQSSQKLCDSVQ